MADGLISQRSEGTLQGGPLSPLLANVLLDEVDRELERRGHRFVRYADDCNVYVQSQKAGERVLNGLRRCYAKLALRVNEAKTAVGEVWGRKFLGCCFWPTRALPGQDTLCRAVAVQALDRLKQRLPGDHAANARPQPDRRGAGTAGLHPRLEGVLPAGAVRQ
jgi:RNA-directed DNA polymerase